MARSNNKPEIPARFFLECVKEHSGCPILLRTDCGTENGIMATMQCFVRQDANDEFAGEKAHKYGSSPSNQRIECWWSSFRRGRASWWIDMFKDMVDSGLFDLGNTLHMECIWFCFHGVLQDDLDIVRLHWNTHRIRSSRHGTVPGIPDVLYHLPGQSGGINCMVSLSQEKIQEMNLYLDGQENQDDNDDQYLYQEYFHYVMETGGFSYPETHAEAFNLFTRLIGIANS